MFHSKPNTDTASTEAELPRPCPHMKGFLSQLADGTAQGIVRWYAERHVADCPNCAASLNGLKALRERLRAFGLPERQTVEAPDLKEGDTLTDTRRRSIESAWAELDKE